MSRPAIEKSINSSSALVGKASPLLLWRSLRAVRDIVRGAAMLCFVFAAPGASAATDSSPGDKGVLFAADFDTRGKGRDSWTTEFGPMVHQPNVEPDEGPFGPDGKPKGAIKVWFRQGTFGADHALLMSRYFQALGIEQFRYQELYLRYYIRFNDDMAAKTGGKLPGLASAGKIYAEGCMSPNGTDAWSVRFMWGGSSSTDTFHLQAYPYVVNKDELSLPFRTPEQVRCGGFVPIKTKPDLGAPWYDFKRGVWYAIEERVKLNEPGKKDGILQVWIDDSLVLDRTNVLYRTVDNPDTKIGRLAFESFLGGSTPDWAAPQNESMDIADLVIATRHIGLAEGRK
ncbi:MAG: hypothetical protein F8N15_03575 [Methanobacterium sp.]|nr:hypothetical protein [Methanobacterium sp.]